MEQTLLESRLEQTLLDLGMPLGERVYAEDLNSEADIDDIITGIDSTRLSPKEAILLELIGKGLTAEQFDRV